MFAYRNLHSHCWSLRQRGLIAGHADEVSLGRVSFRVNEKGRQRVLREGRNNVHAGAVGYVIDCDPQVTEIVRYNPYHGPSFVIAETGRRIEGALAVKLAADGEAYV